MKIGMYSAVKTIYSGDRAGNMQPVAFDYVPRSKRGIEEKTENANENTVNRNLFTGFRSAVKTA